MVNTTIDTRFGCQGCLDWFLQEPTYANLLPISYANLLPARQDEALILLASQSMNHNLPDLYQLAGFSRPTILFNIWAKYLLFCRNDPASGYISSVN